MSFDPFRPDDAGDYSASFVPGQTPSHATGRRRSVAVRVMVALGAVVLLGAAAVVAVIVA